MEQDREEDSMTTSIVERVGKLLKQAEATDNEAEREAYMRKAQAIATVNAVDLALARQAVAKREEREQPVQKSIYWGSEISRNLKVPLVDLFSAVASANDVKINIYHNSSGVIAFGFPSDIDVVETLFASLAHQMQSEADAYMAEGSWKSETVRGYRRRLNHDYDYGYGWEPRTIQEYGEWPVHHLTARSNFYQGYCSKIGQRLREARREAIAKADDFDVDLGELNVSEAQAEGKSGAELVLLGKGLEVQDFYKATSNARGSWKGGGSRHHVGGARSAGSAAGARARLSSAKAISA
jgi:hypothetical protein